MTTTPVRRRCMLCGDQEEDQGGLTVYPVWSWYGRFMGRWCDWCRELRCWDCSRLLSECNGTCSDDLPIDWGSGIAAPSLEVS